MAFMILQLSLAIATVVQLTSAGATDLWTPTKDIHGTGGVPHNIAVLDNCKSFCMDDSECVAIDWEPNNTGRECWTLTGTWTYPTTEPDHIINYQLNRTALNDLISKVSALETKVATLEAGSASDDRWILIQRGSKNGTVSFDQDWAAYRDGFGSPHGDDNYWKGLRMIRCLCGEQRCRLKVEVQRTDGHWYTAEYSTFSISDEADKYRLSVGGYSGDAGDAFNHPYSPAWSSNGMRFSTKDNDNDQNGGGTCAVSEGWWFNWCSTSSLNRLLAIWSDAEAIADVQASRMWVSTDEQIGKGSVLECELAQMQFRNGATYIRWGRKVCGSADANLVYEGRVAGPNHSKGGSTANFLCLHNEPQWGTVFAGHQYSTGSIWGASYGIISNNKVFSYANNGGNPLKMKPATCAVCDVPGRTRSIMIPARTECPSGWTKEYSGYLAGESTGSSTVNNTKKRSTAICVDEAPEATTGSSASWNSILHPMDVQCGTLPCATYTAGKELTCVVCSK